MPTSKTRIVNVALGRIGVSKQISDVDTENSELARLARSFFEDDLAYVIRDFPWPFLRKFGALNLVDGAQDDPVNYDWVYSYRYPDDCAYFRRITREGMRNDPTPPPFVIGSDDQGRLIYTNEELAFGEWTKQVTDCSTLDPITASAVSWKIGASFAPSQSRIKGMMETCLQMYMMDQSRAEARALNESQQEQPLNSEFESSRS